MRLNKEGTAWKALIYAINWKGLWQTGTLDGNLLRTIEDDACIQGTRPEYVSYKNKWYVATADYGNHGNEVRLYNPEKLSTCTKTSDPGVLYKKFTCTPWVQNLNWIPQKGLLVLIQNQIEGRKWRFTAVDRVPDNVMNAMLWKAIKGENAKVPAPVRAAFVKTVKKGDGDND
ncbi:hypothetical protein [uncultured Mucilaginibacter sp.]|uniref:hypothetical protein n=1 Tax=uncultured Mucilaginibacter sp. TaxID=797541 RepID=UPI0025DB0EBB|nr:hypothetical protein [uncultured Mucilaginibacter sp.]